MIALSQSFRMGTGNIEHNLRITKGRGMRQNGVMERRHMNELLTEIDTSDNLVCKVVEAEIGDRLAALNEHHIATGHPERVRTVKQWIETQQYTRQGKRRPIVHEYVVSLGNKLTACPYEVERDSHGNMLDVSGSVIPEWDTRHTPAYKDGVITESEVCTTAKDVYREFLTMFKRRNPNARVICAVIHADENGSAHMHISVVWINSIKNGVGIGLSKTSAMQQQYDLRGITVGDSKQDNAQNSWRVDMKLLLKKIAYTHGIEKLHMGNKEKYRTIEAYGSYMDARCAAIDKKEKELLEREKILLKREKMLLKKEKALEY